MNVFEAFLQKLKTIRVLVIGDIMLDHYIMGDAERISPEAPVPIILENSRRQVLGGAANVALNIRALGGTVELCGLIGADEAGRQIQKLLKISGIEHDICFIKSYPLITIHKTRVLAQGQQVCRIDAEASPEIYHMDPTIDIPKVLGKLQSIDIVIFSDYAKGSITEELVASVSKKAQELGVIVCMDPKPLNHVIPNPLHLLTPNRIEAMQMAGIKGFHKRDLFPAELVCKAIWKEYKPLYLVITLGKDGMLISQKGEIVTRIPTFAQDVFDVSGAGDTVIATLALALAAKASIVEAVHLANLAAGVVVGKEGTATTSIEEILAYQASHKAFND